MVLVSYVLTAPCEEGGLRARCCANWRAFYASKVLRDLRTLRRYVDVMRADKAQHGEMPRAVRDAADKRYAADKRLSAFMRDVEVT